MPVDLTGNRRRSELILAGIGLLLVGMALAGCVETPGQTTTGATSHDGQATTAPVPAVTTSTPQPATTIAPDDTLDFSALEGE